jgi:hypothetical protein
MKVVKETSVYEQCSHETITVSQSVVYFMNSCIIHSMHVGSRLGDPKRQKQSKNVFFLFTACGRALKGIQANRSQLLQVAKR